MTPGTSIVGKFRRLTWADRLLVVEAMTMLILASVAIAVLPFRSVGRLAAVRTGQTEPAPEDRARVINRVRWAIIACARRMPWRAMCFEQGFAAQRMLRRRGIASVLYFGASPDDRKGLAAHVWVRDGDTDVVGGETASQFAVLATFPPRGPRS